MTAESVSSGDAAGMKPRRGRFLNRTERLAHENGWLKVACGELEARDVDRCAEIRRLEAAWAIAEDALASISGERTPKRFPKTSYDIAQEALNEARAALKPAP